MNLLINQTSNTTGTQDTFLIEGIKQRSNVHQTIQKTIICEGTFNGCLVTVEVRYQNGEWVSCGADAEFSEASIMAITLTPGFEIRGSVASVGASTDISLRLV